MYQIQNGIEEQFTLGKYQKTSKRVELYPDRVVTFF